MKSNENSACHTSAFYRKAWVGKISFQRHFEGQYKGNYENMYAATDSSYKAL